MTHTEWLLQQHFGASIGLAEARAFIMANVGDPRLIYDVSLQLGLDSAALGEIVGVAADEVEAFFAAHGMEPLDIEGIRIVGTSFEPLADMATLLPQDGPLSLAGMREYFDLLDLCFEGYEELFDPLRYAGSDDGVFTPQELGFAHLGELPATRDTLESLFYGTFIHLLQRVDSAEGDAFFAMRDADKTALGAGDPVAIAAMQAALVDVYGDAAGARLLEDYEIQGLAAMNSLDLSSLLLYHECGVALFDAFLGNIDGLV